MKILIVGGSGLIGGRAAIHLSELGHDVTTASRNPPGADTPMAKMPFLQGNYIEDSFTKEDLAGFDVLVFAAGQDTRHVTPRHRRRRPLGARQYRGGPALLCAGTAMPGSRPRSISAASIHGPRRT